METKKREFQTKYSEIFIGRVINNSLFNYNFTTNQKRLSPT